MEATCSLCPRNCAAPRFQADCKPGYCGAGNLPRVFRWGPHFGEEPPLTGERGSGCVFFSRCTMKCLYCQNSPWSWRGEGVDKTIPELTAIFRDLATKDRVENWNLVSPTPYLPFIREAVAPLIKEGIRLPFVWNSSGYEKVETLEEYKDLCDWALFDLRYSRGKTAAEASSAPNYVDAARAALKWAHEHTKVICRILVLPGHADEAIENLAWIATELSSDLSVSIMSQYTPAYKALETPPFNRGVTQEEYDEVTEAAADFGFEQGWIQGFGAADPRLALLGENMSSDHGTVR
jgi:putative pyruvate formate lyase activating enzyme